MHRSLRWKLVVILAVVIALVANLAILLGAMASFGAALTLPGIAGLILTIGVGVDSNVLIFERIREELKAGQSVRRAVAAGFDRVLLTILDTHVTSLVAAAFLFQFGSGNHPRVCDDSEPGIADQPVHDDRGLANDVRSDVVAWPPRVAGIGEPESPDHPRPDQLHGAPHGRALGVGCRHRRRPDHDDGPRSSARTRLHRRHRGGRRVRRAVGEKDVRQAIPGPATIQRYGPASDRTLQIRVPQPEGIGDSDDDQANVRAIEIALDTSELPESWIVGTTTIGPTIGRDLQRKGAYAMAGALAGISAYLALRFRPSFAAGAAVATCHDLVVTVAMLSLAGYDFDLNVVAALLTVAGYSVNDTIVIFDRVRERLRTMGRGAMGAAINAAITDTLARTIITSGTTLVAVLALYLFGGTALGGFAFTVLVGIFVGTWSSVFVAAPVAAVAGRHAVAKGLRLRPSSM
jgi:SecD/SecF fusion protein